MPEQVRFPGQPVRVRARYDDQRPAWLETAVGKGKVVYLAHRAGLTYTAGSLHPFLYHTVWADTGRDSLTLSLVEARVERELTLSEPSIVAAPMATRKVPMSTHPCLRAYCWACSGNVRPDTAHLSVY